MQPKYLSDEWREKLIEAGFPESELVLGCSDEILRRLPQTMVNQFGCTALLTADVHPDMQLWEVNYLDWESRPCWINNDERKVVGSADTLANAASAMYCYLSTNNLLS